MKRQNTMPVAHEPCLGDPSTQALFGTFRSAEAMTDVKLCSNVSHCESNVIPLLALIVLHLYQSIMNYLKLLDACFFFACICLLR